jgi:hypothetical protein
LKSETNGMNSQPAKLDSFKHGNLQLLAGGFFLLSLFDSRLHWLTTLSSMGVLVIGGYDLWLARRSGQKLWAADGRPVSTKTVVLVFAGLAVFLVALYLVAAQFPIHQLPW